MLVTDLPRRRCTLFGRRLGRSAARRLQRSRDRTAAGALAVVARRRHWPPRRAVAPAADAATGVPPRGRPASEPPVGRVPREQHARGPSKPIGDDARCTRRAHSVRGRGLLCAGQRQCALPPSRSPIRGWRRRRHRVRAAARRRRRLRAIAGGFEARRDARPKRRKVPRMERELLFVRGGAEPRFRHDRVGRKRPQAREVRRDEDDQVGRVGEVATRLRALLGGLEVVYPVTTSGQTAAPTRRATVGRALSHVARAVAPPVCVAAAACRALVGTAKRMIATRVGGAVWRGPPPLWRYYQRCFREGGRGMWAAVAMVMVKSFGTAPLPREGTRPTAAGTCRRRHRRRRHHPGSVCISYVCLVRMARA